MTAPIEDPADAIDLLQRLKCELDAEIQSFERTEMGDSLCLEIDQLAYEIVDAAGDHIIQKSWQDTKRRWGERKAGT